MTTTTSMTMVINMKQDKKLNAKPLKKKKKRYREQQKEGGREEEDDENGDDDNDEYLTCLFSLFSPL